jgi:rhomboid-like protein
MKTDWKGPEGPPPGGPTMPQLALPQMTPVTKRLLIINGLVFLAWFLLFLTSPGLIVDHLLPNLGVNPGMWREMFPLAPVWQPLTYGFLHDPTSLFHLGGNMLMLYFFGTMLEGIIGSRRFLITYLAALFAGAFFCLLPALLPTPPIQSVIGASGAVYGVMIAVATMRPRQAVFLLFIPITMKVLALGILAISLFGVLLEVGGPGGGDVSHLAHLGGIAYGFAAVKLGWIWRDPVQTYEAKRAVAAEDRKIEDAREMDRILAKIHSEGMTALTKRERAFLKRVS